MCLVFPYCIFFDDPSIALPHNHFARSQRVVFLTLDLEGPGKYYICFSTRISLNKRLNIYDDNAWTH